MKWHNINEEDATSLNFLYPFIDVYPRHFQKRFGFVPRVAMEMRGDHVRYYLHDSFVGKTPELYQWLAVKNNFEKLEHNVYKESAELHRLSDATVSKNIKTTPDAELARKAVALSNLLRSCIGWGLLPPLIDFAGEHISKAALNAIEAQVKNNGLTTHPSEYFVTLTTPAEDTLTRQEERSILDLAHAYHLHKVPVEMTLDELQKTFSKLHQQTRRHAEQFVWTYFGYCGPALTIEATFKKAKSLSVKSDLDVQRRKQAASLEHLRQKQQRFELDLKLDAEGAWAVHMARKSVHLKSIRKDAMVHCAYALDALIREVAKRTGMPLRLLRAAKSNEMEAVLDGTLKADTLRQRNEHLVYLNSENSTELLMGKAAQTFARQQFKERNVPKEKQITGQCAQPGKAAGTARIIDKAEHMHKMNDGDILVSIATVPEIVPAMKKAAAIVTEIGGITSHAAIVSRELGVPCVIGTKVATKWLKDGDRIEVDATNGVVRKL